MSDVDAVVIGAGPNGLVAANLLADEGWSVLVLEAQPTAGGAVRSAEVTLPGFVSDLFSAFYPLAAASPILANLELDRYGLHWRHAPEVVAHPTLDGPTAVLSRDLDRTAASLDAFAPGDGDAWRLLAAEWARVGPPIVDALFTPFPPVRPGLRLVAGLGRELPEFARRAVLPVRRWVDEDFRGAGAGLLLGANALHADLAPETPLSSLYGWLLCMLGQTVGFPVPEGGAQRLADALVARLEARGGRVVCSSPVTKVLVRDGCAVGVRTAGGAEIGARRAVVADTPAPTLLLSLLGEEHLPPRWRDGIRRFHWDQGTVKVDWALNRPIPWTDGVSGSAGTVHVAPSMDELSRFAFQLACGQIPDRPFVILGQMTASDPSRSPAGTESAWCYAHVPARPKGDAGDELGDLPGGWDDAAGERYADRLERLVERFAPGFRDAIGARYVQTPTSLERHDANLVGGAIGGGSAQIHQQLIFRPVPGLARPEMPVKGLYLASASAHPGGGVHGAPGANAAKAALHRSAFRTAVRPLLSRRSRRPRR